jgi:hypothetical protein
MLPYRRRPPVYGGKLAEKKKQEAEEAVKNSNNENSDDPTKASDPLHGGGPVQRAIEHDLLDLRTKFVQLLHEEVTTNHDGNHRRRHMDQGQVFGLFKTVFGEAKIALLHSRVVPPRCDRDAYSQLIYAACLSLVKKSFESTNFCLEHATFGLFCLYTLYQTNPLPTGPPINASHITATISSSSSSSHPYDQQQQRKRDLLAMLPMGLQSLDNPKALYRRAFKQFIRIDRYHYSLLLRLAEECRAHQAECQEQSLVLFQSKFDADHQQDNWRCHCGIATDGIEIVARVLETVDLVEYTGPCSVEGLVGHADYPFTSVVPPNPDVTSSEAKHPAVMTVEEFHQIGTSDVKFHFNDSFFSAMREYRDKVQLIRLPPMKSNLPRSEGRIRKALEPMFGDKVSSWAELYEIVSLQDEEALFPASSIGNTTATRRIKRKVVSFQTETISGGSVAATGSVQDAPSIVENNPPDAPIALEGLKPSEDDIAYEIVLPSNLSESTQEGIEKAVQLILTRSPNAWWEKGDLIEPGPFVEPDDDLSTLHGDGVSVFSQATGPGRAALRNLLASVDASGDSNPRPIAFAGQPSDQFLFDNLDEKEGTSNEAQNDESSDLSDPLEDEFSDEDDVSVAVSTIGRRALHTLLSKVSQKPTSSETNWNGNNGLKSKQRSDSKGKRRTNIVKRTRASASHLKAKKNRGSHLSVSEILTHSESGKTALEDLLSRVAFSPEADNDESIGSDALST